MQLNSISFPVQLTQCSFSNGGMDLYAYYYDWDEQADSPYAGGWGLIGWNVVHQDGQQGTNLLGVHWTGPGKCALSATDTGLYAAISTGNYKPVLALTDGGLSTQVPNQQLADNATLSPVNLGNGNVAFEYGGQYLSVNYSDWSDWSFWTIGPNASSIGQYQTILVSGSPFWILLVSGSGVNLNLNGQDLSEGGYIYSLAGTDFSGAVLENANLGSLPNLSLAGCNFTNAYVNGTILTGAQDLNQATWIGANLWRTDLSQVDPAGTPGVNFTNADMGLTVLSNGQPLSSNHDYSQAQFVNANLQDANLSNVSFVGADFTGASLTGANLDGADLTGANLTGADFTGATLAGTILTGANLSATIFNNIDLSTTIFDPSPAFGTSTATRTSFQNATVPATSLGMNWSYIDLTGAMVINVPSSLAGLIAENTLFPDGIELGNVNFQGAHFTAAQLFRADFTGADLGSAVLDGAFLKGAKLDGANLAGASLQGTWLIAQDSGDDPDQYEAATVTNAFLINTVLDQAQAAGVDFSGSLFVTDSASATQASAQGAFMVRSSFNDAVVVQVSCRGTQFSGAQFANTILVGSTFPSCEINPTSDEQHSVPTMHDADIRGTLFADVAGGVITNPANMDGLEMAGAVYSTEKGVYKARYKDYYGNPVDIYVDYGVTVLGTTTSSTTCPNGQDGPCTL